METTNHKTPQQQAAEAFLTGHYPYLLQALAIAIDRCLVWRLAATGEPFNADDLFRFAKAYDEAHPLEKGAFYMVSREGAIGLAPGLEYMVKWMFLPMERGAERDRLLQQLQQVMAQQEAEETMPPPPPAAVADQPANPAPPQKAKGNMMGKACLGCGCAFLLAVAAIIGIGGWMFYKHKQQSDVKMDKTLKWVDSGAEKYKEAKKTTYKGQLVSELAAEHGLPSVVFDERPKEGKTYINDSHEVAARFNFTASADGERIGTMTLSSLSGNEEDITLHVIPCGCSIYHLLYPEDSTIEGYLFVNEGARRIQLSATGEVTAFSLTEDE